MALQPSQRLPELHSTGRSPTGFFSSNSTRVPIHIHHTSIQRILHPESNSTCRRQRALRVLLLHPEGKETFSPEKKFYTWKARRSSRNPSMYTTKTFQAFQPQDLSKAFQSFMTFQPLQAILQIPVSPGNPPHSSILQLECIFYIFCKFYSSIGFHRNSTEYQLDNTNYKHSFFKEREMLRYRSYVDIFSRIELFPSIVLSCEKTNYKNDIHKFL